MPGAGRRVQRHYQWLKRPQSKCTHLAYAEVLGNEQGATAAGFLGHAVGSFTQQSIRVEGMLSDNGSCYRSHMHRAVAVAHQLTHRLTRPYRPQTEGEAGLHPHHRHRVGLRPGVPHLRLAHRRLAARPLFRQPRAPAHGARLHYPGPASRRETVNNVSVNYI